MTEDTERLFFDEGLPLVFLGQEYLIEELEVIHDLKGGPLIQFGSYGDGDSLCVRSETGEVVVGNREWPGIEPLFCNSSLRKFCSVLLKMNALYPFFGLDCESGERKRICDRLMQIVCETDLPAAEPDLFWTTLIDDVYNGDYVEEE